MTSCKANAFARLPSSLRWTIFCFSNLLVLVSTNRGPLQLMYGKECARQLGGLQVPQLLAAEAATKRKRVVEVRRDPETGAVIYPKKPLKQQPKTPLLAPHPIRILKKDSFPTYLDLHKKVLVYYYATDRCPKCADVRKEIDEVNEGLIKYFYSTTLAQVDVAVERVLANQQDVERVPALLFYEEGTKSPPERYHGKWSAKRILDWVRRQDGSFVRHLAAARLGNKAPMSAEDEEAALKTAAANSPFVTVFAYVVPGSAKEQLIKNIARDDSKLRGTLVHILPVQEAKDARVEVHKAQLPYDLYEEEKIIDYGPSKWSKNEIQRILWEAQQRVIYPEPDDLVDELAEKKSLATILFDEGNSDHQEYVDLFFDYAKDLQKEMVFSFLTQREARKMENFMGLETGWPTLLVTEAPQQGRKNVLESGSYTYRTGPKKYKLNGPFSWGAADQFFHYYKEKRLPATYRSILPPERTWEIVDADIQDLCHHNLKSLLGGLGKWIFVLYYDTLGSNASETDCEFESLLVSPREPLQHVTCEACEAAMKTLVEVGRRVKKWTVTKSDNYSATKVLHGCAKVVDAALNSSSVYAVSNDIQPLYYIEIHLSNRFSDIGDIPFCSRKKGTTPGDKLKEHIVYEGEFEEEEIIEFMKSEIRRRWKHEEL